MNTIISKPWIQSYYSHWPNKFCKTIIAILPVSFVEGFVSFIIRPCKLWFKQFLKVKIDFRFFNYRFLFISLFLFVLNIYCVALDQWTTYYSYKECFDIAESKDFIIGATELGLILYHKETHSLSTLNKSNGLSDTQISAIGASKEKNIILVGYENGNIDIVKDDYVLNIPDLKIEQLTVSKSITHFLIYNEKAFCSTNFGIIELDLSKNEIISTLIIGDEASYLKVNKTFIKNDTIYAATSKGLLMADMNNPLFYYKNWSLLSQDSSEYIDISDHPSGIMGVKGSLGKSCLLILFQNEEASILSEFKAFYNITPIESGFIITTGNGIFFTDNQLQITSQQDTIVTHDDNIIFPFYRDLLVSEDHKIWIADRQNGLFYKTSGNKYQQVLPQGPYSNEIYKTKKIGDELWILTGGFNSVYTKSNIPASISIFKENSWLYLDTINTPALKNVVDFVDIAVNPFNDDNIFIASYGQGLFEFDKNNDKIYLKKHYTANNSPLMASTDASGNQNLYISGLTFSKEGYLYINHSGSEKGIIVFNISDSTWHPYNYGTISILTPQMGDIIIDNNGYKWTSILQGYKGIFVFDDNSTIENLSDDQYRGPLSTTEDPDNRNFGLIEFWDEYEEVSISGAYCIEKDKNGYLWFGTDNGIVVQYNPSQIFNTEKPSFTRIIVPRNDGSGLADYLLEGEKVTSIAVDEANRKYIGTVGNGIYLLSEDGLQTVSHFTTQNAPLPSDTILNIDIDKKTGEVFFSTSKGLISYHGKAIEGSQTFDNVFVYPNPVRPEYGGLITITGLLEETNVKITDTQGNLVYETISLGGNAFWNGKNLRGEKVKSGIYIIFLTSLDGEQRGTTKVAIIR